MSVSPERIEKALTYADSWEEGAPEQLHIVVLADALREARAENRALKDAREAVEHREGMVEIYDWQGVYLGCMGIETWQAALAPADEAKP